MSDDSGVSSPGMVGRLGPGSRVAGYVIEERVGSGGMAVVFRARDEALRRLAALKVLAPALADDEEFRARFLRESRSVAAVEEPHIVPVYAAGEADGVLYLATRFVAGGDLSALLRRAGGALDPARAAALVTQVASALDAAHAAGLVHRDVKPGNVLIDDAPGRSEHAYLSDFGLSKAVSSATGLTASGVFLGTPDYCAPEQITGRPPVSARSDQYSLACVAFHMLTGTVPYRRGETLAVLFAHLHDPVPSPSSIRPELPGAVDSVLAKAMAREPAERYGSCGEFASALREAVQPPGQSGTTELPAVPPAAPQDRAPAAVGEAAVEHSQTGAAPRFPADVNHTALPSETIADTPAAEEIPAPETAVRGITATAPAGPARRRRMRMGVAVAAAAILGAVATWAGLTPPGSPGAATAAVVGNQRITVASLDTQVANLKVAARPYGSVIPLTSAEMPRAVLTWLIKFAVMDQVAAENGISVTPAQADAQLSALNSQAAQAGFSSGKELLIANGIPPQMFPQADRWLAETAAYQTKVNGGRQPSSQAEATKVTGALDKAQCSAAKTLNIQVNPQYGRFDYASSTFGVVAPSPSSTEGLVPAC